MSMLPESRDFSRPARPTFSSLSAGDKVTHWTNTPSVDALAECTAHWVLTLFNQRGQVDAILNAARVALIQLLKGNENRSAWEASSGARRDGRRGKHVLRNAGKTHLGFEWEILMYLFSGHFPGCRNTLASEMNTTCLPFSLRWYRWFSMMSLWPFLSERKTVFNRFFAGTNVALTQMSLYWGSGSTMRSLGPGGRCGRKWVVGSCTFETEEGKQFY